MVEANVNQIAALVSIWAERFELGSQDKHYKLKKKRLYMYENLAIKMAIQYLHDNGDKKKEQEWQRTKKWPV